MGKRTIQLTIGGAIVAAILIAVAYQGFQSTIFFQTPGELIAAPEEFEGRTLRMGALVVVGSSEWDSNAVRLRFDVTENGQQVVPVVFDGVKPDMFREGQGVVVEGRLGGDGIFRATEVLVKHSEEYSAETALHQDKEQVYKTLMQQGAAGSN